jgi:dihydroorotate dehydrogenase
MSAERAHKFVTASMGVIFAIPGVRAIVRWSYQVKDASLERELWGIKFPNPVGLAAGFDKEAAHIKDLSALGFGFIEIGTLTPVGQPGNPKPRLFRLPKDEALINRMGFNNGGVEEAVERLKKVPPGIIVGGNIGKNKVTPNEEAIDDYVKCFEALHPHVQYFVVNVSSPNTPNLRALQDKGPLTEILSELKKRNSTKTDPKPILLKIAPDLTNEQLDDIVEIAATTKIEGVIATNTTIDRSSLTTDKDVVDNIGAGGVSGKPVANRSTEVIRYLKEKSGGELIIIGVGGIHSADDAQEKLDAGASLVQVYTGFIYEGPMLVKRINRGLIA